MKLTSKFLLIISVSFLLLNETFAQKKRKDKTEPTTKSVLDETSVSGLKFRSIGPAITSGRIADFAVNPNNIKEFYVASAAGGVWKTYNAGNTFKPIFDGQGSFSIGCITLDPNNSNVVWVGTGENNNQRSVDFGDGIYRSNDGGKSWKNMGLKNSEHIGMIAIDPRNSDVIYVAAVGPVWSSGGDRGVYKSTDGGETWNAILTVDEHTGANEILMDPRNPDVLYAAMHQRRRHVFTYIGGGPGSGIFKSTDAGATWNKINKGLPTVDMGRIGLAISPADPEKIYAIVEAAQGKGGFYRSTNRGATWEKRNSFSTSGNYYQELFADPVDPDKVYAMNNWMRVTKDGGKTFDYVGEDFKHIDNHAMWINPNDTDHIINGNDGGVATTWDAGKHWDFMTNLPVTQFYKVALDNAEPFYNIYGGTQDNFSLGGPSRTISGNGIANSEWFITHGGDGFESQVDQKNPNIVYAQSQHGVLVRYDKKTGEELGIQPKPRKGENSYRWNWDAPLVVSNHKDGRIYFAANKVFKSDDYGNSWQVISEDITAQIDRNKLKVMGRVWGIDAVSKNGSTSQYGTIVALDESPIDENLIIVGTDDGLIQITENGGQSWSKKSSFQGVPANTYVNMVLPSLHDVNVIYACFNDHKRGNFTPYVYKSTNKGATWTSITSNLPGRGHSFAIAEDHVDPNLLFVGTEFGIFFSNNGGASWKQLKSGLPITAVRDIAIQKRENDLVLGTFGRGFYVLDDYSSLRSISDTELDKDEVLFGVRDALQFEYSYPLGLPKQSFQGDDYYLGENLGSEALFTYYIKNKVETLKDKRLKSDKKLKTDGADGIYPSYESLIAEQDEEKPYLLFEIESASGNMVRRLRADYSKGISRIHWDLQSETKDPVSFYKPPFYNPFGGSSRAPRVAPGAYTVKMYKVVNGVKAAAGSPQTFQVKALNNSTLPAKSLSELAAFQEKAERLNGVISGTGSALGEVKSQLKFIKVAAVKVPENKSLLLSIDEIESKIKAVELQLNGDRNASRLDIGTPPSVRRRIGSVLYESMASSSGPTQTHLDGYNIALEEFTPLLEKVRIIVEQDMPALNDALVSAGAAYTPGTMPKLGDLK